MWGCSRWATWGSSSSSWVTEGYQVIKFYRYRYYPAFNQTKHQKMSGFTACIGQPGSKGHNQSRPVALNPEALDPTL